jgi:hypothetical protein
MWTVVPLREQVDAINTKDPEVAHVEEDELLRAVIEAFCPEWVVTELQRLNSDRRWYA